VWVLVVTCLVSSVAALRLAFVFSDPWAEAVPAIVAASVGMASVGALIVLRRPGNVIGWLLAVAGAAGGVNTWLDHYVHYAHSGPGGPSTMAVWMAWLGTWSWAPLILPIFFFLPLLFPDGRLPSPRWRPAVWIVLVIASVQVGAEALRPGPMRWGQEGLLVDNPLGVEALGPYADAILSSSALAAAPFLVLAVIVAPVIRWRRSRGVERQQMKWFLAAVVLLAASERISYLDLLPATAGVVVFSLGIVGLPVAIGIAVLRYRLYEIDRIVSRTVSYALLTAVLVGVYAAGVVGLGGLVRSVTGGGGGDLVVAASTLAVAALFGPARRRIQGAVDRRFNRSRYDAQRTVESFAQRLRDEVDLDTLSGQLREVASAAIQPRSVSVWLRALEPGR
jgi:hypothetical protein